MYRIQIKHNSYPISPYSVYLYISIHIDGVSDI